MSYIQSGPAFLGCGGLHRPLKTQISSGMINTITLHAGNLVPPHKANSEIPFSINELRAAIPDECFERNELKFISAVAIDYLRIGALGLLGALVLPACDYNIFAVALYALLQGTLFIGPWELAHECGHGSFSRDPWANDLLGAWLHITLLMPYWTWQRSHAHHHKWPNHIYQGEGNCPGALVRGSRSRNSLLDRFENLLVQTGPGIWAVGHLCILLGFGWWGYLIFGISGAPAWGGSSHFFAPNGMFPESRPGLLAKVNLSNALLLLWIVALIAIAHVTSVTLVAALYFAPYFVSLMWLTLLVTLQHTAEDVPHFGNGEYGADDDPWTLQKGVFHGTIDHPAYGWVGRELHHEGGTCHVIHHIFPQIPFYNAQSATDALDTFLHARGCSELHRVCKKPIHESIWEFGFLRREVVYTPETGNYRYVTVRPERGP